MQDSLVYTKLPSNLVCVNAPYFIFLYSTIMEWGFNRKFCSNEGIRQCDLLSPNLFVDKAFMNRLIMRFGNLFGYLEVVLCFLTCSVFYEASLEQATILSTLLNQFRHLLVIKWMQGNRRFSFQLIRLNQLLSLSLINWGSSWFYLGMSIFHQKVKNATFQFLVDRGRSKLSGWEAKTFSLTGRITLAKSELMAIPNYFM